MTQAMATGPWARSVSMVVTILLLAVTGARAEDAPIYAGHDAAWWVDQLVEGQQNHAAASAALQRLGPAASDALAAALADTNEPSTTRRLLDAARPAPELDGLEVHALRCLDHDDGSVRAAARRLVTRVPRLPLSVGRALVASLDRVPATAAAVPLRLLARLGVRGRDLLPALVTYALGREDLDRLPVLRTMQALDAEAPETVGYATALLHDPDSVVREGAIEVLIKLKLGDAERIEALRAALDDPIPRLRAKALNATSRVESARELWREAAIAALEDPSASVRDVALRIAANQPEVARGALGPIADVVLRGDRRQTELAMAALEGAGEEALLVLPRILTSPPRPELRTSTARLLKMLNRLGPDLATSLLEAFEMHDEASLDVLRHIPWELSAPPGSPQAERLLRLIEARAAASTLHADEAVAIQALLHELAGYEPRARGAAFRWHATAGERGRSVVRAGSRGWRGGSVRPPEASWMIDAALNTARGPAGPHTTFAIHAMEKYGRGRLRWEDVLALLTAPSPQVRRAATRWILAIPPSPMPPIEHALADQHAAIVLREGQQLIEDAAELDRTRLELALLSSRSLGDARGALLMDALQQKDDEELVNNLCVQLAQWLRAHDGDGSVAAQLTTWMLAKDAPTLAARAAEVLAIYARYGERGTDHALTERIVAALPPLLALSGEVRARALAAAATLGPEASSLRPSIEALPQASSNPRVLVTLDALAADDPALRAAVIARVVALWRSSGEASWTRAPSLLIGMGDAGRAAYMRLPVHPSKPRAWDAWVAVLGNVRFPDAAFVHRLRSWIEDLAADHPARRQLEVYLRGAAPR